MPGPGNSRCSLETPSGQWLDPSIAQTCTGDKQLEPPSWMAVPTSAAADLRGKGARQPGKGAERNMWRQLDPLCHAMQQIAEYKPFGLAVVTCPDGRRVVENPKWKTPSSSV
jgi:hypothetical protein